MSEPRSAGAASTFSALRLPWVLAAVGVVLILAVKGMLIGRININWDEFYFLNHVHDLERGELKLVLQGAFTHLFGWLTALRGTEVDQIIAARWVMFALLVVTVTLIWALTHEWVGGGGAAAAFAYVAMSPVLRHGASFRADSLMIPLVLLALLTYSRHRAAWYWSAIAGIALGLSTALTVKTVLMAPLFLSLAFLAPRRPTADATGRMRAAVSSLAVLCATAAVTAGLALVLHKLSLPVAAESTGDFVARTMQKTLLEVPWIPQSKYFEATLDADWLIWLLFAAGFATALLQRRWLIASVAAALLPVLFYRNAFPYFYIVMLAPVSVLAATAIHGLHGQLVSRIGTPRTSLVLAAVVVLMLLHTLPKIDQLRVDDVERQRVVVEAVHQIFPQPLPYIDHSGMIASFPKANFFMSTWGVEHYRGRGIPFMPAAIERKAALMLVNRSELQPATRYFYRLLPEDQRLIQATYVPYWGPIWVAGTSLRLAGAQCRDARVSIAGRYRIQSPDVVTVSAKQYQPGDSIELSDSPVAVCRPLSAAATATVKLVWADAKDPPPGFMPAISLYSAL